MWDGLLARPGLRAGKMPTPQELIKYFFICKSLNPLLPFAFCLLFPILYSLMITITGKIERRNIGLGAWAFVTDDGVTYEIPKSADRNLLKSGQKATITGKVRDDIMTTAMIGPVLQVESFEIINSD